MIARVLYYASFVVIAITVSVVGVRMWRDARGGRHQLPLAVALVPGGRIELGVDRRTLVSPGHWRAVVASDSDRVELVGSHVLVRSARDVTGVLVESGAIGFVWNLPIGETWGPQDIALRGSCLVAMTRQGDKARVHCLDDRHGSERWVAEIAGGATTCTQAPIALPGAFAVPCAGSLAVLDEPTGALTIEAGGIAVLMDPPRILRASPNLTVARWLDHRFAARGEPVRGTTDFIGQSAVARGDRIAIRATRASDKLAIVSGADTVVVASTALQLADEVPLTSACGGPTAPRFQLLALAPRLTATFDPDLAARRAFALLDLDHSTLAWTSQTFMPTHGADVVPLCVAGHYFVPLELRTQNEVVSVLWIIDAETGRTTRVIDTGTTFADLTAPRIDARTVVSFDATGMREIRWAEAPDARARIEPLLGTLP